MTATTPAYCSTNSRDAAEPLWGTARHTERWLLIEYPGAWPAKVLKPGVLPQAMMDQLDALRQAFPSFHTLFIRQGHTRAGRLRAFLVDCREEVSSLQRLEFDDYEQLAAMDLAGGWEGRQIGVPEPALYLVCTHGTHDKCFAKFGLPIYAALTARQPPDRVWEASHLGGHRFAANVISFPTGVCYGRVTPDDVPRLMESDARRELDLSHYRGRFALAPPVQAAEYFLRTRLSLPRLDDLRQDRCTQIDDERWSVSFRDASTGLLHHALVAYAAEPLLVLKDCEASAAEPVRPFFLADYRVGEE
jgi:hypothetical protein